MKIIANDIRTGNVILSNDRHLVVFKATHIKPGKGGAYIQIEAKDVKSGTKIHCRFRSSESVEKIHLEQSRCQFLYEMGEKVILLDTESYEQIEISKSLLGEQAPFLKEGIEVTIESHNEEVLIANLPATMELKVIDCESVVKGQTAASSYKPALLENNVRIMVPPFINPGETIIVDIREQQYLERSKSHK